MEEIIHNYAYLIKKNLKHHSHFTEESIGDEYMLIRNICNTISSENIRYTYGYTDVTYLM